MEKIGITLKNNAARIFQPVNSNNVNVDSNSILNNVYDEDVARRIKEAIDKPRAIGEILSEKLNAPQNKKFYIKLAHQFPFTFLMECLAITDAADRERQIKTSKKQYFFGVVKRKQINEK